MTAPMRVQIQRPDQKRGDVSGRIVGQIIGQFLDGYLLMLALPFLFHTNWSYWQSLVAVVVAKALVGRDSTYAYWTVAGKKVKR